VSANHIGGILFDMKNCKYCGFGNADGAASCQQCGQQEFVELNVPAETVRPGTNFRKLIHRFLAAAAIWLIVSGISIYVAWGNASTSNDCRWEQYMTRLALKHIADSIAAYRHKFGVSPQSFDDLAKLSNDFSPEVEHPIDGWGHPMVLSINGTNLMVTSYGRDGKPGGIGLDYDLTTEDQDPQEARPTFQQFLYEMPTRGMIVSCFICGGLAGLLGFFIIKIPELSLNTMIKLVFKLMVMVLVAVFMASIIAGLHIPVHEH
jgi:hypothetical protein